MHLLPAELAIASESLLGLPFGLKGVYTDHSAARPIDRIPDTSQSLPTCKVLHLAPYLAVYFLQDIRVCM